MKTIRLLKAWEKFQVGQVLEVDENTCKAFIADGTAELYDAEAEAKAIADKAAENQRIVALVGDAVKAAVKEATPATPAKPTVITDIHEKVDDDPRCGWKSMGEFCKFVYDAGGPNGPQVMAQKATTGLNTVVDSEGGFLIPPDMQSEILTKLAETGRIYNLCRNIPVQGNTVHIPFIDESSRATGSRQGGVRSYEVAEGGQATASYPTFGQLQLSVTKEEIYIPVTDEMLSDSPVTMGALLPQMAANEFGFRFDDKIINGAGAAEPLGILNAAPVVSVSKETGQTAATIVSENVLKMWARLWNRSRTNAVWFVNQDTLPQLYSMYVGLGMAGMTTFLPPGGLSGSMYATLMGRPIIEVEQCATLGTVGDIILADMSQYLWVEKAEGMQTAQSIHIRFDYGETVFRFTVRRDGRPWWRTVLTPFTGTANTVAPFVTLATRA